jgi:hypothetical protein
VPHRHCELCGHDTEQRALYSIRGCVIYRCEACGLGSTALPPQLNVLDIYDESYFFGGQSDGYGDYLSSEVVLRREFKSSIARLRQHAVAGGRLLEVGCAYGFFPGRGLFVLRVRRHRSLNVGGRIWQADGFRHPAGRADARIGQGPRNL